MTITLTINGSTVQVNPGASVLDAVNASGTYISQLCKDPDIKPIGACRTCLVQIEGQRGFPASCSVPAADGMKVVTDSPQLRAIRRGVVELTLAMVGGPSSKPSTQSPAPRTLPKDYRELTIAARWHEIDAPRWASRRREAVDASNPVFNIAMDACILCGRCAQACQDGHQFIGAIDFLGAGRKSRIGTFMDKPLLESICTTCGQCLSVCPTGAIEVKAPVKSVAKTVNTTCPYCGVGCGVKAQVDERDRIVAMLDDPANQSSVGMLCVKGRFGYTFVHHNDRLTTPLIRREGQLVEATWNEALDLISEKLAQYRGDEFATLCSAKATNEDGYVQQKFSRLVMQSNHIDHCTRLCHSPSVEAMLVALGSGATSNSYIDYEEAGCLVIIGSDANSNHPVAASRMRRAVIERGAKLIVINPRRIEMCDYAELWLRPRPGTDVALLNAMAKVILDEGLADMEFIEHRTENFEAWRDVVAKYDLQQAEELTGVPAKDIAKAARIYARPPFSGSCLIWGMGITQHTNGTANAHGLLNLAFVAGQLGKPGGGISPLRGQNNVQGCGDAGCLPTAFPGYQTINPSNVAKFTQAWGNHPIPPQMGMVVTDMVQAAMDGKLKAMYVTGENPLLSEPDLHHAEKAFKKLEFLVVQDIFLHETSQIAHVVLPAASFAEKDGTFTNSERRVQRVRKAVEPIGNSRPDWEILCDLATRMSRRLGLGLEKEFAFMHPAQIWDEMARLTPIVAGISYERLDKEGGIQWPCPTPDHPGTRYLYATDFPRGPRAKFVPFEQGAPAEELPTKRFPLILNTGRILYHWHGGTITCRADGLLARAPELQVSMSAEDGAKYGVADGEWIRVLSRRGELEGRATFTDKMRAGEVFVPFVKLRDHAANFLTNAAFDPNSKIPEYKVCAVRIEKIGAEGERKGEGRKKRAVV
ncbi:MAG: formate dehydrogenase subunit alpha [SAR202 cluster bacterium]|nr:formate dehydrogenase subunit alpha [SAR202 cluster bacterium]